MATLPKWSTPDRQVLLLKLFLDSRGFCIYGHKKCPIPAHYYEVAIEHIIEGWKEDDRESWKLERKALHSLGERRYPIRGRFNTISKDIFFDKQPLFYLEGLGFSGLKLQPFAKVKIASSYFHLYIDLGDSLKGTSKNRRRKAIRYGKPLPLEVEARVKKLITLAVKDYLNH
ncbi:unnamed protein product [marine sediment metagenome]|uniref:Uncharacterized protein n=1 Tax=marine sediment metagenome TaxID=412755 RepID=X1PS87_9ZZZZ